MGAGKSKPSDKGQIFIETDKHMYLINDTIRGVVNLNIIEEGFEGDSIFIKFVGLELGLHVTQENSMGKKEPTIHSLKKKFINCQVLLHSFKGHLPIIQCQYPFEIPLISLVSTTLSMIPTVTTQFQVKFYLCACVDIKSPQKLKEVIKYKVPIVIARPFVPLFRPIAENQAKVLSTCFCCSKGVCHIELKLPITDLMVGQSAKFTLKIDNTHSKNNISRILIIFKGYCIVTFEGGYKKQIDFEYDIKDIGSLKKGVLKTFERAITIGKADSVNYALNSSMASANMIHKHSITAKLVFDMGCFGKNQILEATVPITVVQPPQTVYENYKESPDDYSGQQIQLHQVAWNPQIKNEMTTMNPELSAFCSDLFEPATDELIETAKQEKYNQYHAQNQHYQPMNQNEMIIQ